MMGYLTDEDLREAHPHLARAGDELNGVRRVYVASSWRNPAQPEIVEAIRAEGHHVYDFRNPEPGDNGFHWSDIEPEWEGWDAERYVKALSHPVAEDGFGKDKRAMDWANRFVLVLPCGRSAHLELGWAIGAGKPSAILMLGENEPELMYKLADLVSPSLNEVLDWLAVDVQEAEK